MPWSLENVLYFVIFDFFLDFGESYRVYKLICKKHKVRLLYTEGTSYMQTSMLYIN